MRVYEYQIYPGMEMQAHPHYEQLQFSDVCFNERLFRSVYSNKPDKALKLKLREVMKNLQQTTNFKSNTLNWTFPLQ